MALKFKCLKSSLKVSSRGAVQLLLVALTLVGGPVVVEVEVHHQEEVVERQVPRLVWIIGRELWLLVHIMLFLSSLRI